ncbi:terminase small subunit [Bacillus sp. AFS053548]|uniref:terminase small subunit n=1 Tax=Bacillus sp. AFS053548 TaxID=2033505 RepID=UPI000BFDB54C|nr:terminase small subunit [Bacillus sp. AFS053548]PGM58296.1 hypothetical protein CN946_06020 [Bacillus sp. AFS053548]
MRILSPQHQVFVDEHLTIFNASKSAVKAGFAPTYANRIGYELLQREDNKCELDYAMEMRFDQNKMERETNH